MDEVSKKKVMTADERDAEKKRLTKDIQRLRGKETVFHREFKVCYLDKMVQYELRMVLSQISPKIQKKAVCNMQVIMGSL